jgi:hypothetical protein
MFVCNLFNDAVNKSDNVASTYFVDYKGSLPRSQEPAAGLYPEPIQSRPHSHIILSQGQS